MNRFTLPFVALVLSAAACLPVKKAQADFIFMPSTPSTNTIEPSEGNASSGFPFNSMTRYQQVYQASDFGLSPVLISQIAFRPDGATGNAFGPTTISSIQIDLARSTKNPESPNPLSPIFADNIISGSLQNIVNGALTLSSSDTPNATNTAREFDIIIDFSNNPYSYDPSTGNLLLDVRNFSGEATTNFDTQAANFDSVGRIYNNGNANAPNATNISGAGLVTRFTTTAAISTPEPDLRHDVRRSGYAGCSAAQEEESHSLN